MEFLAPVIVIAVCAILFSVVLLERFGRKSVGSEDEDYDEKIEQKVSDSLKSFVKQRDRLVAEKKSLPQIGLLAIKANDHREHDLIAEAEKLRNYVAVAYGEKPDSHLVDQQAQVVPIDYPLAHALVTFAHLVYDLRLAAIEWHIRKIELLGLTQKRHTDFGTVAVEEFDLRTLEQNIEKIRSHLLAVKRKLWESFSKAQAQNVGKNPEPDAENEKQNTPP
jgi:hypothetical protein